MDKYEITAVSKVFTDRYGHEHLLYQVRALRDFGRVKAGELGCFVENKFSLSQTGTVWPDTETVIFNRGSVSGDGVVERCVVYCSTVCNSYVADSEFYTTGCHDSVVSGSVLTLSDVKRDSVISNSVLKDCVVSDSSLESVNADSSRMQHSEVKSSQLSGMNLDGATVTDSTLSNRITGTVCGASLWG